MKILHFSAKVRWTRVVLALVLAFCFIFLVPSVVNWLSWSYDPCFFDQWTANISYQNQKHLAPADMLINELPQHLIHTRIVDPNPWLSINPTKVLDKDFAEFSVKGSQFDWALMQEIYWFGSEKYALCRFNRLTRHFYIVPDVLKIGKEGIDHNRNIFGTDALTCNGMRGYRGTVGCTWVGFYDTYITIVTVRIEPDKIAYEDFISIITQVDQKMKLELGIR